MNHPMGKEMSVHQIGYTITEPSNFIVPNPALLASILANRLVTTLVNIYGGIEPMTAPQETTPNIQEIDHNQYTIFFARARLEMRSSRLEISHERKPNLFMS